MKINISTSSAAIAGDVVLALFNTRTVAHMMHLDSRSHAQHVALDSFYTDLVDLADRFAECAIGNYKALQWPEKLTIGLTRCEDPVSYLSQLKEYITSVAETIEPEDLRSILAEILELITGTLYKLEKLS